MLLTNRIRLEKQRLSREARTLEAQLLKAPEGSLRIHKDGASYKWFRWESDKRTYLSKKNDRELAEQLALKRYRQEKLSEVKKSIRAIDSFMKLYPEESSVSEMFDEGNPFRELLLPSVQDMKRKCLLWQEEPFESNPGYPEQKKIRMRNGEKVRSKSEAYILNSLREQGIAVRYECLLEINGKKIYPDFTIMHPLTGTIYLWEHFGLFDDENYRKNAASKLNLYAEAGFYPTINLIITSETSDKPLDMQFVLTLIEYYFL